MAVRGSSACRGPSSGASYKGSDDGGVWRRLGRAFTLYRVFGLAVLVTSYVLILAIQVLSTYDGLVMGQYSVLVKSNVYGESILELFLEVLALPAVILITREFMKASK